jgi:hypothetical protein
MMSSNAVFVGAKNVELQLVVHHNDPLNAAIWITSDNVVRSGSVAIISSMEDSRSGDSIRLEIIISA